MRARVGAQAAALWILAGLGGDVAARGGDARGSCELAAGDAAYFQSALDTWGAIVEDALRLPAGELPWMILFGPSCAYHLNPDPATGLGRSLAPIGGSSLRFAGRPVTVGALPVAGTVALPSGQEIPAEGLAFAGVYREGGGEGRGAGGWSASTGASRRCRTPSTTTSCSGASRRCRGWRRRSGRRLRFVADWRRRVFPPELASPVALLEGALRPAAIGFR
jgi:hypothetical protein